MKVAICMRGAIGKVGTWGQRFHSKTHYIMMIDNMLII